MKPIKSLLLVGIVAAIPALAPSEAAAQPGPGYYAAPPPNAQLPGGFHNRQGRLTFGFSLGLGAMNDDIGDIGCNNCDYSPISFQAAGHIGGFIGPRMALMLELQTNGQQVSQEQFVEDDAFLYQTAAMIGLQYWVTPQLWLKGGLGLAHLEEQSRDGFFAGEIDNGTAVLGAIGFELFSSRYLSVDLQGRVLNGSYSGIDNNITAASVGVGINWF
jgi:hypothetical protein